ncbi:hypothetical protein GCM10007939_01470 [Amylibacter marinus]|uniref:Uncharacterized protein n=2 Tax=Amylibacter marinus TaxID=1475483 RepID=A0ABQ5VRA5_9RHOB|nr:hypothetical protein GCM10007939_01470 [Amylibacter marinus]
MVERKAKDSLGRRSRMKPQSTGKRIRLTERDLLWMQKIHEHGPLSTREILAFSEEGGQNKGRAQNRLTDLFNEENNTHGKPYLTRPEQQFMHIDARYNQIIYGLSKAGEKALKEAGLWSDWVHKAGGPFWHQRMVAQITAEIEIDCRRSTDRNYIQGWKVLERAQTRLRCPVTFKDPTTGKTLTKTLIPDQIYGIEYLTEDGPRYKFWVLEAERGTHPKTSKQDRKSVERMEAMYDVGLSKIKAELKLKAPLVLSQAHRQDMHTKH